MYKKLESKKKKKKIKSKSESESNQFDLIIFLPVCHSFIHGIMRRSTAPPGGWALTRAELGYRAQQVVVDDGRGIFTLAPAHWRRGGRRDEELFDGLRGRQVGLVDVLVAILDLRGADGTTANGDVRPKKMLL